MRNRDKSQAMKEALLKIAEEGGKRPNSNTPEGRALNNYTSGSNSYDAQFDQAIRQKAPSNWFRTKKGSKIND